MKLFSRIVSIVLIVFGFFIPVFGIEPLIAKPESFGMSSEKLIAVDDKMKSLVEDEH